MLMERETLVGQRCLEEKRKSNYFVKFISGTSQGL